MLLLTLFTALPGSVSGYTPLSPALRPATAVPAMGSLDTAANQAATGYPWRGLLIGGDHGGGAIHHDNIYIKINGGPILYQTTIPARKSGNLLEDAGLLWHFYTRDLTEYTLYATSSWVSGTESDLSLPFPLAFLYSSYGCTEQTVPNAISGTDQRVEVGTEVLLDGTASLDPFAPDTAQLVYRWECYAAPESSVVLSDDGQSALVRFTPTVAGNYYFRFNVRDQLDGSTFNRSPVTYVRVKAVPDLLDPDLVDANPGRGQQIRVGDPVTLDGSDSLGPEGFTTYSWTHENPVGTDELSYAALVLGAGACQGECYQANFDGDSDVDGSDLAVIAANWGCISLPDEAVVDFTTGIARPHIFTLTVSDGITADSDTTIVSVHHPSVEEVLTHPPVDSGCL